jgi:hypothetical protein
MKSVMRSILRKAWPGGQSGQVEVETAVVMPAVIFLLLGLMQLGMLHQARLFTKYAAYRAVRAGVVKNADVDEMERSALAAALPILSRGFHGSEVLDKTHTPILWLQKLNRPGFGGMLGGAGLGNRMTDVFMKYVEVTICGPLQGDVSKTYSAGGNQYMPFDDPSIANTEQTKLRIELLLNYRLVIPFADWTIFRMARGRNITNELRLGREKMFDMPSMDKYGMAAAAGVHILPMRAQYAMKMHSDVEKGKLPTNNECKAGGGAD